jgi:branched-subunit amino acid aminotransferase/4-amino-4-deoxychorismate lyase
LKEHIARFRNSCDICHIPQTIVDAKLAGLAQELLERNMDAGESDGDFVLIMLATPGEYSPNLILSIEPIDPLRYRPLIERGARLVVPSTRQLPAESIPAQAKMRSRMHWWIAEREAKEVDPAASAILLDAGGHLTETASANIAIVQSGTILTPPRSSVLDGISLRVVEELCRQDGIPFADRPLSLEDCFSAEELLLTSTPYGVCGVSSLNGRPIPWRSSILRQLHESWSRLVGVDIWREFLSRR